MNEKQLKELLDSMTVTEKIGQMFQGNGDMVGEDGAVTGKFDLSNFDYDYIYNMGSLLNVYGRKRLKKIQKEHLKHNRIPLMFMGDIIYGYRTIFPLSLAMACTFDPDLVEKTARISASQTTVDGVNVTFSPMCDIARDARWGRCAEGYGEEPLLSGRCAAAMVKGYQGNSIGDDDTLVACVKHFAAYGATCDGRDYNSVEMSERKLRDVYLKPYEAAVKAGAGMIMTSFNTINGVPASINKWLLKDVLRDEWGFEGVNISDYAAIVGVLNDGAANDVEQIAKMCMDAELDIDMMDNVYSRYLSKLVSDGKIPMDVIDKCVMRILKCKNDLGLLDDPYKYLDENVPDNNDYDAQYLVAKKAVCESTVLLKNDGALPLKNSEKVAVIGPHAFTEDMASNWSFLSKYRMVSKSLSECIGAKAKDNLVAAEIGCPLLRLDELVDNGYDKECPVYGHEQEYFEKAVEAAKTADTVIMPMGEYVNQYGESRSRADISVPEVQMELFRAVYEVNTNIVVIMFAGRPLAMSEIAEKAKAVMYVWFPGSAGGESIAEMLYGEAVPSGKLSMCIPRMPGQVPIYYSRLNTDHPNGDNVRAGFSLRYIDCKNSPLYSFGYGLSYADFEYSNLKMSANVLDADGEIKVSVDVKNAGSFDGDEVVQMYIRDRYSSYISRPIKELKDFKRVHIKSGETATVQFTINEPMLKFHNINNEYVSEPGEFHLFIGSSSDDNSLEKQIFNLI